MSALHLACPAELDQHTGEELLGTVKKTPLQKGQELCLDFSATQHMNSTGGAWLMRISDHVRRAEATLSWSGQSEAVAEFLDMLRPGLEHAPPPPKPEQSMVENLGEATLSGIAEFQQFFTLCVDAIYWTVLAPFEGRGFRWGLFLDEIYEMGVRAIRIVCLMNFLLGLIVAMLLAKQAESYGIQIIVADIIMIGFARELAAIMTAVVVSARTGAAIAAEIATMKVQEEIDAMRGMGLNVTQFLVSPKLLALLVCLPCLVTLAMISGIAGGSLWGIFVLEFQPQIWFNQTLQAAALDDIFEGMLKTVIFAVTIVLVGCHNGLRVSGGSRGVGLMTTRAVVQDIFMIIVIDIIFASIFYYMLQ